MRRIGFAVLLVGAACSGGEPAGPASPPPGPVVASVEVSPPAATVLAQEDTLQLTVTVRDQQGSVMTGQTVSWSSENPAVATVSAAGKVVGVAAGTAAIAATAAGKTGRATVTVSDPGPRVSLDPQAASSTTIGSGGGSLSATTSDGTRYTLEVPEGALIAPVRITLTPVTTIRKLGLLGGLAGAVDLQPSGITFTRPAVLRIRTSKTAPQGTRLVGFNASGDFSARELAVAAGGDGELAVLVFHFSLPGVGFGTTSDVTQFPQAAASSFTALLGQFQSLSPVPWDDTTRARATTILQQMFDQFVGPGLRDATTDIALLHALENYSEWRWALRLLASNGDIPIEAIGDAPITFAVPTAFADENEEALNRAGDALKLAVDGNAHVCGTQASLRALKNMLFWFGQAIDLGVHTPDRGLDHVSVMDKLEASCARVSLLSSNLPAELDEGTQFDLDLRFGLTYNNGVQEPVDLNVALEGSGLAIQNPQGFTGIGDAQNPLGSYKTVITGTASGGPIVINLEACLMLTERTPPQPDPQPRFTGVCQARCLMGGGGAALREHEGSRGVLRPKASAAISDEDTCEELYFNDFSGEVGDEWSSTRASTSPNGQRFFGELGFEQVTFELTSLPAHDSLIVEFDLYIIDSWNGNGCEVCSGSSSPPDIIFVDVPGSGGTGRILQTTFSNKPRDAQAYPGSFPGSENAAATGSTARNSLGYPEGEDHLGDSSYRIRLIFPHTGETLSMVFGSQQTFGANERWGLDNVRVRRLP